MSVALVVWYTYCLAIAATVQYKADKGNVSLV